MKRQLTFQQHSDNGMKLRQAWAGLIESRRLIDANMPKTSRAVKLMDATMQKFDALRTELDSIIGVDCPQVGNDALNHVYFGFRLEGQE
jgi:hypothetical protein